MNFGSQSIGEHLVRGVIGISGLAVSLWTMNSALWPSFIVLPIALVALRGCPICWTVGLVETFAMRIHAWSE